MPKTILRKKEIIPLNLLLLFFLWLIIQFILFRHFGIVTKGEAIKYIAEAEYWKQYQHFSQPKYLFYSVYIFIQLLALETGAGTTGVYVFQLALCLFAVFLFYRLIGNLFLSQLQATIGVFLLICCYPWQSWTTHLYTESIFLSLVIIFTYFFLKPHKAKADYLITSLLLLLLLFTRPTGMLFIPVVLLWYFIKWIRKKKWLAFIVSSISGIGIFILLLNYAMKGEGEFNFLKPFIEEHIVCGVPQAGNKNLLLPENGNSVQGLVYYITHNPSHFIRLSVQKLIAFFGMVRSYYSPLHNLTIMLFFYPLYAFAIIGLFTGIRKNKDCILFMISSIAIFTFSVLLTCDDWLNRFIMPVLPFIILLATTGINTLISNFKKNSDAV